MHLKKFFSAAALLGCLTMIFTGCSQKSSGLTPVTLSEVAHSIFYAPMYVAIENGYFADEGLDITLVNGSGADNVMTSLISGDAEFCPADTARRQLPCCKRGRTGFHMAGFERQNRSGRS